jgi:hypothetical protein
VLIVLSVVAVLAVAWMLALRFSDRYLFDSYFRALFGVSPGWSVLRAVVAVLAAAATVVLLIWAIPRRQVARWKRQGIEGKELAELGNSARTTVTQAFGGLALVAALTLTAYQANESRKSSSQNLRLVEEGQATQLLSHAVDQLGASTAGRASLDTRIGALYSLERLGEESQDRAPLVGDILGAYVGANQTGSNQTSRLGPCLGRHRRTKKLRLDVQVALKLIGELNERDYGFASSDIGSADFSGLDLEGSEFRGVDLSTASFRNADLRRALFGGDSFGPGRTDFRGACLEHATFESMDVLQDQPVRAEFDFRGADLRDTQFNDNQDDISGGLKFLRKREGPGIALTSRMTRR